MRGCSADPGGVTPELLLVARLPQRRLQGVHDDRRPTRKTGRRSRCRVEVDVADFRKIQNTPKWTVSGTLNYDTPLAERHGSTSTRRCHYRSKSQQFEIRTPGIDQKGFCTARCQHRLRAAGRSLDRRPARQEPDQHEVQDVRLQLHAAESRTRGDFILHERRQPAQLSSGARPRRRSDRLLRQSAPDHVHCRLQALSGGASGRRQAAPRAIQDMSHLLTMPNGAGRPATG